jgi:hypothetical protein
MTYTVSVAPSARPFDEALGRIQRAQLDNRVLLVDTHRFAKVWHPDGGDDHAPPGYEFASALLDGFRAESVETQPERLGDKMWEHDYWYFHIVHGRHRYFITLQPVGREQMPNAWCVSVNPSAHSLLDLLLHPRRAREVTPLALQLAESVVRAVAEPTAARWVSTEEYLREVAGFSEEQLTKAGLGGRTRG